MTRIFCYTYNHWKEIIICALSCPLSEKCKQFSQWRREGENLTLLWREIGQYIKNNPNYRLELIFRPKDRSQKMKKYACITKEGKIEILTEEQILQFLLQGVLFEEIYELGKKMEIQIKLVPAKKNSSDSPKEIQSEPKKKNSAAEVKSHNNSSNNGTPKKNKKTKRTALSEFDETIQF